MEHVRGVAYIGGAFIAAVCAGFGHESFGYAVLMSGVFIEVLWIWKHKGM